MVAIGLNSIHVFPFPDAAELQRMLRPFTEMEMRVDAVSAVVNDSRNDNPQCVEPVDGR